MTSNSGSGTPRLVLWATRPASRTAQLLTEAGIEILPLEGVTEPVERYIASERLAIERHTSSSFLRGIIDKSLFSNALYLQESFELPVLIVEGEFSYEYTSFSPQAVSGALSAMVLQYRMSVLLTPNAEGTARLIATMLRHEQIGIPEISLTPKRKAADLPDMQRRVIEMLPGCGKTAAVDLLQHFGSVRRIANATEAEFREVRGIGLKKAAELHQVLNATYEAVDAERYLEDAVEAAPELLFSRPVTPLARQHHIYTEAGERHIVDLVFLDHEAKELILVELKMAPLTAEHGEQLGRYLAHAAESPSLSPYLDRGYQVRGILATLQESKFEPTDRDVSVAVIDKGRAIEVLKRLRHRRWGEQAGRGQSTGDIET